jgi:Co/Zn/Cd efflux system component
MLIPILIILLCVVIAWAIIARVPETPPIPKWVWYAIVGVVAIVFLLRVGGFAKF